MSQPALPNVPGYKDKQLRRTSCDRPQLSVAQGWKGKIYIYLYVSVMTLGHIIINDLLKRWSIFVGLCIQHRRILNASKRINIKTKI